MSLPSDSTIGGKFDELAGKAKQGIGNAFGDEKIANEGAGQEIKGHAEQAWGSVKEAFTDTKNREEPRVDADAAAARNKVTGAAETVKDKIEHGLDNLRGTNR